MPNQCRRARLENGLKLDINALARRGFIRAGVATGPSVIRWTLDGDELLRGIISADMSGTGRGWFHIRLGNLDQHVELAARPRHFGGRQWYFVCPNTSRQVCVLWMPPGARSFACRQRWGRQVAYVSQCLDRVDRAHRGKAKINSRLCTMGGFDPDEWDFPPKPKWMRWQTYNRAQEKFNTYDDLLDEEVIKAAARLSKLGWLP